MLNNLQKFTFLTILFFIAHFVSASHIVGSDISYQCTATPNVYKVTIKLYRSCAGVNYCPGCSNPIPNGTVAGCAITGTSITGRSPSCNGINFGNFNFLPAISGTSGIDIIKTCGTSASNKTICTNCNTRTAGTFSPGIEVYTFEGNINLSALPSTCCEVSLSYSECCRSNDITNFTPGNMYTEAVLNRCVTPCNSAPVFTNDATVLVCTSQDVTINAGAIDPDGDSLSYAFGQSLQGFNSPVNYVSPYSASFPFIYLGAPNANASWPGGLRIDPITGDVSFRPLGQFVSNLVIEVTQWKLISGIYTNVGKTRRDIQFQTMLCNNNLPPQVLVYNNGVLQSSANGYNFQVLAGQQICLDIVAQDRWTFSDPNSANWIYADTSDLTWNNPSTVDVSMSNATWTRNYILAQRGINGPKNDSFKFCWTPPTSAAISTPHSFVARAKDRKCPLNSINERGITIKVDLPVSVSINNNTKSVFCNDRNQTFDVNYQVFNIPLLSTNVFTVQLSDSSGSFASPTVIGTKTSTSTIGSITATMPLGRFANANYKIRVNTSSSSSALGTAYPISFVPGFIVPTISAIKDTICDGTSMLFKASPANIGNVFSYSWLKNNVPISGETKDSILLNTIGGYKVVVSNTGCRDTSALKVLILTPNPSVDFTIPNNLCLGSSALSQTFTNTSSISSGSLTYLWKFSDNTTSTLTSPTKTINDTGNLVIKLIATSNNNCADSISKTLAIKKTPVAAFSINDSDQCINGNSFVFTNLTNTFNQAVQYNWEFGDATSSNSANSSVSKVYASAGSYSVKLKATSTFNCVDSVIKTSSVFQKPIVNFTSPTTLCFVNTPLNQTFTNTSSISSGSLTYLWKFSDNTTSTLTSPTKTINDSGNLVIKLIATSNNNCSDSLSKTLAIKKTPVAAFGINDSDQCLNGNSFIFNNVSNKFNQIVNFNWNVGVGNSFNDNSSATYYNYPTTGTFTVKLKATSSFGCVDSIQKSVVVFPKPMVAFDLPGLICYKTGSVLVNFTNTSSISSGGLSYLWKFSDNTATNLTSPIKTISDTGNWVIKLIATSNNNCIDSLTKTLSIKKTPSAAFNINDSEQCINDNGFIFSNTTNTNGQTANYNWNVGVGNSFNDNASATYYNYLVPGNYSVRLKATFANGCIDSVVKNVVVFPRPTANFTAPSSICFKNSPIDISLTNSSTINNNGVLSFAWTFGDNTFSNQTNPTKTINSAGVLTLKLKAVSENNCLDSISKSIDVKVSASALFNINAADQCLKGNKYVFSNNSTGASTYNWLFGDNTSSNLQNPNAKTFQNTGVFSIKLIAKNNNGCNDTIEKTVTVNEHPSAQFSINNASQCLNGNNFSFTNNTNNATRTDWNFGDNTFSALNNPSKSYTSAGTFSVKLIAANAANCYDTIQKQITVIGNLSIGKIFGDTNPSSLINLYPYSVPNQTGATYNWAATNGNILSGQGTNTVNVKWNSKGAGTIKALINKVNFCTDSNVLAVSVNPVGIENLSLENELSVFPNPTKTEITITNKNGWSGKQFIISNIIGQEVLRGKLNQDETIINLSELKAGTYLLSIEGVNKQSIKILKME